MEKKIEELRPLTVLPEYVELCERLSYLTYRHNRAVLEPYEMRCVFGDRIAGFEQRYQAERGRL